MNYAEQAKALQKQHRTDERMADEQRRRQALADEENERRLFAIAKEKTLELQPYFSQFGGFKIANDRVTLEAEAKYSKNGVATMCLKAGTVNSAVMNQYTAGIPVLAAQFDVSKGNYLLERVLWNPRVGASSTEVG